MWQALPPIHSSDHAVGGPSARPSRAEQRVPQQTGQDRRRRPEPPCPTLLHLGVTARSHSLMEYQTHFPTQFNTHYINRYNVVQKSALIEFISLKPGGFSLRIKSKRSLISIIIFLSDLRSPSILSLAQARAAIFLQTCPLSLLVSRETSSHTCSILYYSMSYIV